MLHVRGVREVSGTVISVYNIGTITTIYTEGINTERADKYGLLFVIAGGTVANLARQVSIDNSNFYDPYDSIGTNLANLSTNILNSRYIMVNNINSSTLISPYTRFTFVGTGSITTLSLYYLQQEK